MKLLHYANRNISLFLFFLIGIWGVFFYSTIIDEVIDETDDRLENTRDILIGKALSNPELLLLKDTVMQTYVFRHISEEEAKWYKEQYYNSTLYVESEDEWEPVRIMKSSFRASDGHFYELEIRLSTLERDDMIEAIFIYLLILYILLLICIIAGNYLVLKKTFNPLHKLLKWLDSVVPGKSVPELSNETEVREFSKLNEAAFSLARRSQRAYEEQKQFIENASHELQTPLAISLAKLELLAESDEQLTEKQMSDIDELYQTINRATKLNKSLLLLSRISNGQYPDTTEINMNDLIQSLLPNLMEVYESKKIQVNLTEKDECIVRMNEYLAQILISNVLKNAIIHNTPNGELTIYIGKKSIIIKNSGETSLDSQRLFQRFYRDENSCCEQSNGLGLSITKTIADSYGIIISYSYDEQHSFELKFVK